MQDIRQIVEDAIEKHSQEEALKYQEIKQEIKETKEYLEKKAKEAEAPAEKKAKKPSLLLQDLPGIGEKTLANLKDAGFNDIKDIVSKSGQLLEVKGIGKKKAEKLIEDAKKIIAES